MSELTKDDIAKWRGDPVTKAYFELMEKRMNELQLRVGGERGGNTIEQIAIAHIANVGRVNGILGAKTLTFDVENTNDD